MKRYVYHQEEKHLHKTTTESQTFPVTSVSLGGVVQNKPTHAERQRRLRSLKTLKTYFFS